MGMIDSEPQEIGLPGSLQNAIGKVLNPPTMAVILAGIWATLNILDAMTTWFILVFKHGVEDNPLVHILPGGMVGLMALKFGSVLGAFLLVRYLRRTGTSGELILYSSCLVALCLMACGVVVHNFFNLLV